MTKTDNQKTTCPFDCSEAEWRKIVLRNNLIHFNYQYFANAVEMTKSGNQKTSTTVRNDRVARLPALVEMTIRIVGIVI